MNKITLSFTIKRRNIMTIIQRYGIINQITKLSGGILNEEEIKILFRLYELNWGISEIVEYLS
jgi:hypothetical protein